MAKQSIIHLSDLHIGHRDRETVRVDMIVDAISKSFRGIPVLITGDLTDSATEDQFKEANYWMDKLSETNPILMVPGNHDYCWLGNFFDENAWNYWIKYLGSPMGWGGLSKPPNWLEKAYEPVGVDGLGLWKHESLAFVGVDSGDPKNKVPCARGYISPELADGLEKCLRENPDKTRIVFLHHHPFTDGWFTELKGSDLLMNAVANNCEILLFGHDHNYGLWRNKSGIPLIVASHKTTSRVSGNCLMITLVDIENRGQGETSFHHRLEVAYY
jgi:3',5'-cyclic AMP phosphodiesterase CpdA